ncbi:MAG: Rpp14/Pop5 family protein [Fervidicoccaceae archaeon]
MGIADITVLLCLGLSVANLFMFIYLLIYKKRIETGREPNLLRGKTIPAIRTIKFGKKFRKRYIIFEVLSRDAIDGETVKKHIKSAVAKLFGEPTVMSSGISLIFYDEKTNIGILRVNRESVSLVIASFHIAGKEGKEKKLMLVPIKVTGSLKKAKELIERR